MKFPLFSRSRDSLTPAGKSAQDSAEKLLAETFRMLGQVCAKMADLVESQRLERAGFKQQGEFLKRIDSPDPGKTSE
jgi:hypothetical protein